jgi:hypothetical protein
MMLPRVTLRATVPPPPTIMFRNAFLAAAAVLLLPAALLAQASDDVTVSVSVDSNYALEVTAGAALAFATLGGETIAPTGATTTSLAFSGNATYRVNVVAGNANFASTSGNNNTAMSAGALEWSADAGTTWTALSATPAAVVSGQTPGSDTATIQWQLTAPALIPNDTYTLTVTFSALAN